MIVKSLFLLVTLLISTTVFAENTLVLARAPQSSPILTSKTWSPFVSQLSEMTGIKIELKVYSDRSEFESDIKHGKVDLYFGNPGYGVVGHLNHGYIPLVRSDRKLLEGVIVVKKNSDINNIEQLDGKSVAFPAETAFAASLYLQSRLTADHNINYQALYTGSHENTYRAVLIGKTSAGGGVRRTLESESQKLREQLKIIYTTPGIKSHPLMAHPKVAERERLLIQQAILAMDNNESGKKLLKKIKLQQPVLADYPRDYYPIEALVKKMYQSLLVKNRSE